MNFVHARSKTRATKARAIELNASIKEIQIKATEKGTVL